MVLNLLPAVAPEREGNAVELLVGGEQLFQGYVIHKNWNPT